MRMRNLIVGVTMVLAVALTLGACNRSAVFSKYKSTSLAGWERNDTLTFEVKPVEAEMEIIETLGLRVNDSYPFKALCLIVDQTVFPERSTMSDTINCVLFNDDGKTKGSGVSYYQFNYNLTNRRLAKGDSLLIMIRHNMKREIIPGVSDVGVTLKRISF